MYPARFYFTYPLAFVCGLAGMYALRSEVDLDGTALAAAVAVAALGLFAGWDIARGHQKLAAGDDPTKFKISSVVLVVLALPLFVAGKAMAGSSTVLWFVALFFLFLTVGFGAGVVYNRQKSA